MSIARAIAGIAVVLAALFMPILAVAQKEPKDNEPRAARELDAIRGDPLALRVFLKRMPKGADLHNHLDGAVYAETFIRVGGEDGLCVDPVAKAFTKSQPIKSGAEPAPVCEAGDVPAADVPKNQRLYDELVDSFSMRGFVPSEGVTEHDHFFGTFAKFGGTDPRHTGEFLHEVTARAAAQNEQFLELMETPIWHRLNDITKGMTWHEDLGALRDELLAKGLADDVPAARAFWDEAEAVRRARGQCGEADEAPACKVETLLYPKVRVSLHAGELAPGLVPPEGLCCHVRLAVEQARTDRIGHGVDVMCEDRPYELLKNMADKGVLVEINLTSNKLILGISGNQHPFSTYRKFGVPVALSTDDEGVSRIDLTHEYAAAVETYGLTYADLKEIVRNSLEYSFVPGASLWDDKGGYARFVPDCLSDVPGPGETSSPCASFLAASEKAAQQWELERRFQAFEASL